MVAEHWQIKDQSRAADAWLAEVVRWTWRVKLLTHLETDLLGALREQAEQDAIDVFARNLKDLLLDRKSTRLNSSHVAISYAVFCLKKKRTSKTLKSNKS